MYEPNAVVDQSLVHVNDVGGEPVVRGFAVENRLACAWVSVDEAVGMEYCFNLHFVVVASCVEQHVWYI